MSRPDFFIVGAPRSGTTALYEYLREHPQVFMPYRKEPMYFGSDLFRRQPILDEAGYMRLFGPAGQRLAGEASVWYLFSEHAPAEISAFNPEARIIIMLRDPVEMLYSVHSLLVANAQEDLTEFADALAAEADRAAGRRLPAGTRWPRRLQYRWLGRYPVHVRRYLEQFGAERVKVIIFDDFRASPGDVFADVLSFLGLQPGFHPDFRVVNANRSMGSMRLQRFINDERVQSTMGHLPGRMYHVLMRGLTRLNVRRQPRPPLDPAVAAALRADLADSVTELEELLGRDLSRWKPMEPA